MTKSFLIEAPFFDVLAKEVTHHYSIDAIQDGFLLFFYKINCPTCQFVAPILNRFYQKKVLILGLCQNLDKQDILLFNKKYKLEFPSINDLKNYPLSNAYGIEVVPTLFEINVSKTIKSRIEAFHKSKYEELFQRSVHQPLFEPAERVIEFQPG